MGKVRLRRARESSPRCHSSRTHPPSPQCKIIHQDRLAGGGWGKDLVPGALINSAVSVICRHKTIVSIRFRQVEKRGGAYGGAQSHVQLPFGKMVGRGG